MNGDSTADVRLGDTWINYPVGISGEAVFGKGLHLSFTVDDPGSEEGMRDVLNVRLGEGACKLLVALAGAYLAGIPDGCGDS